jgi:hypothetical protein
MDSNREKECMDQRKHYEMWNLSHKYTTHLMNQIKYDHHLLDISLGIYKQFLSELQSRGFLNKRNNKIVQCWNTMIRTIKKNPNKNLHKQSICLLHQTSVQHRK